jgi:peptide/nickel transport system ATP-binding protein
MAWLESLGALPNKTLERDLLMITEITPPSDPLLQVKGVSVDYWSQDRWVNVVDRISFDLQPGESVGLVGESGCGKTTMLYSMVGYIRPNSRIREGSVFFQGEDLLTRSKSDLQHIRGKLISIVPQNPTTALSPGMRIGKQITETLEAHHWRSEKYNPEQYAIELLKMVSLPNPEKILTKYPHQISGGQQQRVIIAIAISCNPKLLLLDEPTTGLDVTTQAQILDLLTELRAETGMSLLYVTHNLGVVAQICDRIGVMYAGYLVEVATRHILFRDPWHPYTQGLISAVPRISTPNVKQSLILKGLLNRSELPAGCPFAPRCDFVLPRCLEETQELISIERDHQIACWRWQAIPSFAERTSRITGEIPQQSTAEGWNGQKSLLTIENLRAGYTTERARKTFKSSPKAVVEEITLDIRPGETFALVGESGSGKTTVARAVSGLLPYVSGKLNIDDRYDLKLSMGKRSDDMLRSVQYIFQNPDASLNPRQRVSMIIGRPLQKFFKLSGEQLKQKVIRLLADVHLDASFYDRFPDELSGGERQRIAIARALAAEPKLLLCDEILSALDVSVQAYILKLLAELQAERGIAFLFISHDLAIVRSLAHRVGVMYWGLLCETGRVEEVFNPPYHPYTYLLLSAVPEPDPDKVMPTIRMDTGLIVEAKKMACPFAPRCPVKVGRVCEEEQVPWRRVSETHRLRCQHTVEELLSIQKEGALISGKDRR